MKITVDDNSREQCQHDVTWLIRRTTLRRWFKEIKSCGVTWFEAGFHVHNYGDREKIEIRELTPDDVDFSAKVEGSPSTARTLEALLKEFCGELLWYCHGDCDRQDRISGFLEVDCRNGNIEIIMTARTQLPGDCLLTSNWEPLTQS
jgi:hypothetical protein